MVSVWRASAGTVGREDARTRSLGESKSRNKVSVGEPAEGSLTHSQHARCDLQTKKHTSKTSNETLPACSGGMKPTPRGSVRSNIFGVPTKKNLQKFCEFVVLDATHGDGLEPVRSPGRCGSKSGRLAGDRPDVRKKNTLVQSDKRIPGYLCPSCSILLDGGALAILGSARLGGSSKRSFFGRDGSKSRPCSCRSPPRVSLFFYSFTYQNFHLADKKKWRSLAFAFVLAHHERMTNK